MRPELANTPSRRLLLLVFISTVAWSFGPICIRYALEYEMPPALIASGRMLIGAVCFTPLVMARYWREIKSMSRGSLTLAIGAGALFGCNTTLSAASLAHISVIVMQAFIATIPIWVAMLEVTLLKARLGRGAWAGVGAALFGGLLVGGATAGLESPLAGGNPILGLAFALANSLSVSFYIIAGRHVRRSVAFVPYIWLVYTSGALMTFVIIAGGSTPIVGYATEGYLWVLALALLAQIAGHGVLNYAIRFLSATTLTVTSQMVPALGVVWALLILGEMPTPLQIAGGAALIIGIAIVLRGQIQR